MYWYSTTTYKDLKINYIYKWQEVKWKRNKL